MNLLDERTVKIIIYITLFGLWIVYGTTNSAEPPYVGF